MDPLTNGGGEGGNDPTIITTNTVTNTTSSTSSTTSSSSSSSTDIMTPPIGEILSDISSHIEPSAMIPEESIKEELTINTGKLMMKNN